MRSEIQRILVVHNHYKHLGGEDTAFEAEISLLRSKGHDVCTYTVHNDEIEDINNFVLLSRTIWNHQAYSSLRALIRSTDPDVIHVHNTLPLLSPSIYYAANAEGRPVVQTLHNYRLLCPAAILFREGSVCEDCVGKSIQWHAFIHKCYRNSRSETSAVVAMLGLHRLVGTWSSKISVYIALTDFARSKFIKGGLSCDTIVVKPNLVYPDPGPGRGSGGYALYVGRLTEEKGILVMLDAWRRIGNVVPLKIVGDGPLSNLVREASHEIPGVTWLGPLSHTEVLDLMKDSIMLIFPSKWYEGFPTVIVESFATNLPVVASNLGSMASLVQDRQTGIHFEPGSANDMCDKVLSSLEQPELMTEMRHNTRAVYEANYSAEKNYETLIRIYEAVLSPSIF